MQTIPLAAHDTQMARMTRIIKWVIIGWVLTCALFVGTLWQVNTDTITTTETKEVTQDSGDGGSNLYAGGDMSIGNPEGDNDKEDNTQNNIN